MSPLLSSIRVLILHSDGIPPITGFCDRRMPGGMHWASSATRWVGSHSLPTVEHIRWYCSRARMTYAHRVSGSITSTGSPACSWTACRCCSLSSSIIQKPRLSSHKMFGSAGLLRAKQPWIDGASPLRRCDRLASSPESSTHRSMDGRLPPCHPSRNAPSSPLYPCRSCSQCLNCG